MGWMDNNGQTKTKLELLAPKRLPLVSPLYRKSRLIFRPEFCRSWWCIYFGIFWLEFLNNFEAIWYIHYPVQWKFFKNSSAFDQSLYIEVHILFAVQSGDKPFEFYNVYRFDLYGLFELLWACCCKLYTLSQGTIYKNHWA